MKAIVSVLVAAFLAAATWVVPPSLAQTTLPGPTVSAATLQASTAQVIALQNPTRRTISICNTGASNAMWIWPGGTGGTAATTVSAYVLAPVTSNVIACYTPPSGLTGGLGAQWQAKSLSGSTYSVFEY